MILYSLSVAPSLARCERLQNEMVATQRMASALRVLAAGGGMLRFSLLYSLLCVTVRVLIGRLSLCVCLYVCNVCR